MATRCQAMNAGLSRRRSRVRVPSLPCFTCRSFELLCPVPASALWSGGKPDVGTRVRLVWAVEHNVETSATAKDVWRLWADVEQWPEWNASERIELRGPFAVGSTILMTPPGDEPVE